MAQITIKCSVCANDLTIEEEWLDIKIECPICHSCFTVGEKTAEGQLESKSAPAEQIFQRNRIEGGEDNIKKNWVEILD